MTGTQSALACLLCSLAAHASFLMKRPEEGTPRSLRPPSIVQLSVVSTPPTESAPVAPLKPPAEPEPEPAPTRRAVSTKPTSLVQPEPTSAAEPATEPAPAPESPSAPLPELAGTTLVSTSGAEWSAPLGDGLPRQGPLRAALPQRSAARATRSSLPQGSPQNARRPAEPPQTTPLSELSKKPLPPALGEALERNYPPDARRQGRAGEAKVRARIEPSGRVAIAQVTSETSGDFGRACQQTLLASTWSPPLDRAGRPTATWVTYRCKFRVDD